MSWTEYWNEGSTVYVNARHRRVHYESVARDVQAYLPTREARVVDYGCGHALSAHLVADACAQLYLCDSAPRLRESLSQRYRDRPDIAVISPRQFEMLVDGTIDLIMANSVVQYLTASEFTNLLAVARAKLGPGGRLVLADIVPHHVGALTDAAEFLKFAKANGFLVSAAAGLVRTFFSSYRRLRTQLGLLRFDEEEILQTLAQSGFHAHRCYPNVGHNAERMTVIAQAKDRATAASAPGAHAGAAETAPGTGPTLIRPS